MKKKYFRLKIKIAMLIVGIMLLGCGVLTYQRADRVRDYYMGQINKSAQFIDKSDDGGVKSKEQLIKQAYTTYYNTLRISDNVGFYSMLKDKEGNTLAYEQNFILVYRLTGTPDMRIILLGDDFVTDSKSARIGFEIQSYEKMKIEGTCDDIYIYLEKLWWENMPEGNYSYIPEENNVAKGTMDFEEWAGDGYFDNGKMQNSYYVKINSTWYTYGNLKLNERLNREAEKLCQEVYADYAAKINSQDLQLEEGLFTSYVAGTGHMNNGYAMPYVYVFHPISIAMGELSSIYCVAMILCVIIIGVVCSLVNKMYKQQYAYEMNRRELTRGIAHELKTPLAITKGYLDNWEYMGAEEQSECNKIMIDEIEHMNRMVTDLLELSRLEANAKTMNPESVDIYALTGNVLNRMRESIESRGLKVSVAPVGGEFLVQADLVMIRTVLVNFISNAVKYADKEISISMADTGRKIKFIIANDGRAIDSKKADKVWDEFYRDGENTDSVAGSSGLGLAITRSILNLHKAEYGCSSCDGRTIFWFEMKADTSKDI